ncbi:hypothetical protein EVAR_69867_1 [Eumeta japonica]|uniref:Uncharacterized protein n=1 Tax=Eumeta variegata TaxID=151549 RepID=A0A4C2ADF8_EUMVA|nr:hypothetical protein EVAR_69867_1 [Eumeta japonica]
MSGGNSKNKGRSRKHEGWEEAGGEFYQELYPGASNDQDILDNLQRADAAKLATLLPSKQVRNALSVCNSAKTEPRLLRRVHNARNSAAVKSVTKASQRR